MAEPASQTFLDLPSGTAGDLFKGDIAILGAPDATPYVEGRRSHSADGPAAIRAAMTRYAGWTDHYDFDFAAPLIDGQGPRIVDLGDLEGDPSDPAGNRTRITSAVQEILAGGAVPIVFGGDDSVPIPVLAAYEDNGPIWIVQVDAHMDWREERGGVRLGWSSTMRRASEMAHVEGIIQAGIRGTGSAGARDVEAADAWGAEIVTAREVHDAGMGQAVRAVPGGSRTFLTIDCDALDPAVMPAVMAPAPGGLTYWQVVELIEALAERTNLVGFDLVELAPARDVNGLGALTAGRIVCNLLAALGRG